MFWTSVLDTSKRSREARGMTHCGGGDDDDNDLLVIALINHMLQLLSPFIVSVYSLSVCLSGHHNSRTITHKVTKLGKLTNISTDFFFSPSARHPEP